MNMKLLLFILGLTLCASWPAFSRNLAVNSEENNEEHSFLDFLDGELGEYENFADGDNDNSFDLFDLNFHLNEEGEVNTSLGEENNEEFLPEEPSDEPTEETQEENSEAVVGIPQENTEDTTQEENPVPEDLLTQVRGDAEANDVLNFGVSTVIAKGINTTKIPNDNFTVTSISTYNKTGNAKRNVYQISCVATNANESSVININFTVYYQLNNQRKTLSSWSYSIKTTTLVTPITEFAQLGEEEIATETVQNVLNYGAAQIYAKGTQAGKIPVSDFTISDVVSVWKQATTNGFNYRCQVVLENNNKVVVNANFTVAYKSSNQKTSFIQWSYNVKNVTSNANNNTTTPTNNTAPSNTTDANTNTTNTTAPVNTTNTTNSYTELTQDEINSAEVQAALNFGAARIIQHGYDKGQIPVSNYTITKINSVSKQAASNGRNAYKCDVELQDVNKVLVKAKFNVYVKVSTQEKTVGAWSYQVSNKPSNNTSTDNTNTTDNTTQPTDDTNNNSTANVSDNTTQPTDNTDNNNNNNTNNNSSTNADDNSTNNNTTQPTDNTNTNNNTDSNTTSSNTTEPITNNTDNNTTSSNTTEPATNNTTPANNTNANNNGFVELETAEIETSGEVQGALEYGTDQIIQSGNAKGKIPVSNYTITKVNSVERKTQSNGRNTYRCDVELQDAKKVITAQFTVYVKVATQEFSIGGWTYNISNIKTSNSNGSNNITNTTANNNTDANTTTTNNTTNDNNNTTQPTTNTTSLANTTNSTTTNFTALTQDEINSAEVQGALNFGANRVIQIGSEKGQIPVSNYTITKVNSVGKQVASNGRNLYRFDVELQDVNKVLVKAQFNVYVKVATQERTVGAWSYQVSNKGNAPKPSTNTTNSTNTKTL